MSKKRKLFVPRYQKWENERSHSTKDILKEFSESMESPEIPIAQPPQGVDSSHFFPPQSKRAKRSAHHEEEEDKIDLTDEADTAMEQPMPGVSCLTSRLSTSSHSASPAAATTTATGQMAKSTIALQIISKIKQVLDSPQQSPTSTRQQHSTTAAHDSMLARAPIKQSRQSNLSLSSGLSRAAIGSQQRQPSSSPSRGRVERSFTPSMSSSLPALQSRRSDPSGSNVMSSLPGNKRLPSSKFTPGALVADIYDTPKSCPSPYGKGRQNTGRISAPGKGRQTPGRETTSGKGRQGATPVVVIDSDEGEHSDGNLSRDETETERRGVDLQPGEILPAKEVKAVPVPVSWEDVGSPVQMYEMQTRSDGEQRETSSLADGRIPSLSDLKRSQLDAIRDAESAVRGRMENTHQVVPWSLSTATGSASGLTTTSSSSSRSDGGGAVDKHDCETASSNTETDDSVLCVDNDTVSKYFSDKRGGGQEHVSKRDRMRSSANSSPPDDILAVMDANSAQPDRRGRDVKTVTHSPFVPRCKSQSSPEEVKSSLEATLKHHTNCFAKKKQSKVTEVDDAFKSPKGGGMSKKEPAIKLTPKFPSNALSMTPTLSKEEFSIPITESNKEKDKGKATSQSAKYPLRDRDKHVRISKGRRMVESSDDDDFQPSPVKKKPAKNNKGSFYGAVNADTHFGQLLGVASGNVQNPSKSRNKLSKSNPVKGIRNLPVPKLKSRKVKPKLTMVDDDDMTFELLSLQIGRLICDGVYNLEVRSKDLCFQFQCDDISMRHTIELKHLTSWKMFLGEGPRLIAIKIVPFAANKLKNILIAKFHLRNDFFAAESSDPSQCSIVFRLGGRVSPEDVANITEVVDSLNGLTLEYCKVSKDLSSEEARQFLDNVKPTEPAREKVKHMTKDEIASLTRSQDEATVTGQSRRSKQQLVPVRRSQRPRKPRSFANSVTAIEDSDNEEPVRPRAPNVKLLTYKPVGSKLSLDIMSADLECLEPGEYLNDKIIDFYLNYLLYEKLSENAREKVHVFSTFFYTRLSNASMDDKASGCSTPEKLHSRVKTWTRRVDLFNKDYVILPVCDRAHWYVVIVCHPGTFDPSKVLPRQSKTRQKCSKGNSRRSMRLKKKGGVEKAIAPGGNEEGEGVKEEEGSVKDEVPREEGDEEERDEGEERGGSEETAASCMFKLPPIAEVYSVLEGATPQSMIHVEKDSDLLGNTIPETPPTSSQDDENAEEPMDKEEEGEGESEGEEIEGSLPASTVSSPGPEIQDENSCSEQHLVDQGECSENFLPLETGPMTESGDNVQPSAMEEEGLDEGGEGGEGGDGDEGGEGGDGGEGGEMCEGEQGGGEECVEGDSEDFVGVSVKEEPKEEEEEEETKKPCILILDSLGIKRPSTAKRIRNYLTVEWKLKKADKGDMAFDHLPLRYPEIPFQDNSSDCGIFVLQFVESLLGAVHQGNPLPSASDEWASYEQTRAKRKQLDQLIRNLQEKRN